MSTVILGDLTFSPGPAGRIQYNNPRSIAMIDIPGAPPVYQDMGEDESTLSWPGKLIGDDAYQQALKIEDMKNAGLPVQLTVIDFPEMSKMVRIRSFPWDLVREDRVDYTIELVVETPPPAVNLVVTPDPPEQAPQEQAAAQPTGLTYTIKQGDTLWDLATKHLGTGTRWREIADANGITNPRTLQIGQVITIPS